MEMNINVARATKISPYTIIVKYLELDSKYNELGSSFGERSTTSKDGATDFVVSDSETDLVCA